METLSKWILTAMLTGALAFSAAIVTGCDEGPAEEAGREVDEAVDEVEDAVD